jgi:hypothetical protein
MPRDPFHRPQKCTHAFQFDAAFLNHACVLTQACIPRPTPTTSVLRRNEWVSLRVHFYHTWMCGLRHASIRAGSRLSDLRAILAANAAPSPPSSE